MLLIEEFLYGKNNDLKVFTEEGEDTPPPDDAGGDPGPPPDLSATEDPPSLDGAGLDSSENMGDTSGGMDDMGGGDDFGSSDDMGMDDNSSDDGSGEGEKKELSVGEKISNVLNGKLYQRYLALLNRIENQILTIKNNLDIFNILFENDNSIINILKKLSENIRIYINEKFIKENYSNNKLFFNKCINLYKMTNDELVKLMKRNID